MLTPDVVVVVTYRIYKLTFFLCGRSAGNVARNAYHAVYGAAASNHQEDGCSKSYMHS